MMTRDEAVKLLCDYIDDSVSVSTHREYRQEITKHYDDIFAYFPNKKSLKLFRGYTFRKIAPDIYYKHLLSSIKGRINNKLISSWSSDLNVAVGFFDYTNSQYCDYSLLIKTKVDANSCINATKATEEVEGFKDLYDESEFILPPVKSLRVKLIAAYANSEDIYWTHPKYAADIRRAVALPGTVIVKNLSDFIDNLKCLNSAQKDSILKEIS